ncbi:efflux RND transporter periplasmic adaptor subunit [Corallococcus sp. H22C18031201]|uniref:efflux RND transporter periplasmic adaptor subunit n=1 Tax=Citreicoccus inhibens TaxID=2849499 RepID=UPI000E711B91|nr:efflux RND transporter periplasmic adaptor subunit [Citreicoccus inhibens]MBU8900002.1 efflux RND transporter periplasmic adaptor subunit [Citreicoccus inhibens]RJS20034.1 efflux RND transporter periplasmic adaptor subunit [Corallococcus sp. H22C18031201]
MKVVNEMPREVAQPVPASFEEEGRARRIPRWVWVAVGVVGLGALGWWRVQASAKAALPTYETAKVEPRRLVSKVTATGTLSALVTVQVGSQVSGRIQEINVDYNSPVKKGQIIARIDPQLVQAALARAKANMTAARANLQKAKVMADVARKQADRSRALRAQQFISQSELDTAESSAAGAAAEVMASEGSLAQAQAALNEAEVNEKYTTIVSPTDGIVISRSVDVGQTVAASLQAPTLFTIAEDLRKMQVDTSVAESDVGRLEPGMKASFTVDAYPGERFTGVIRQIRNAAQTVQNVVTYDAVIDVSNPDLKLKPGMTANATIITGEKHDALSVPNAALRFRPVVPTTGAPGQTPAAPMAPDRAPDGTRALYVLRGEGEQAHPEPVRVRTGMTDGTYTEIVEGELKAGDAIITSSTTPGATTPPAPGAPPGGLGGGRPPGMRRGPF